MVAMTCDVGALSAVVAVTDTVDESTLKLGEPVGGGALFAPPPPQALSQPHVRTRRAA
jgi:hypothetical protein